MISYMISKSKKSIIKNIISSYLNNKAIKYGSLNIVVSFLFLYRFNFIKDLAEAHIKKYDTPIEEEHTV